MPCVSKLAQPLIHARQSGIVVVVRMVFVLHHPGKVHFFSLVFNTSLSYLKHTNLLELKNSEAKGPGKHRKRGGMSSVVVVFYFTNNTLPWCFAGFLYHVVARIC